jgi:hypothetical protein
MAEYNATGSEILPGWNLQFGNEASTRARELFKRLLAGLRAQSFLIPFPEKVSKDFNTAESLWY